MSNSAALMGDTSSGSNDDTCDASRSGDTLHNVMIYMICRCIHICMSCTCTFHEEIQEHPFLVGADVMQTELSPSGLGQYPLYTVAASRHIRRYQIYCMYCASTASKFTLKTVMNDVDLFQLPQVMKYHGLSGRQHLC